MAAYVCLYVCKSVKGCKNIEWGSENSPNLCNHLTAATAAWVSLYVYEKSNTDWLEKHLAQVMHGYLPLSLQEFHWATCQEQAGELLAANTKPDLDIESYSSLRMLVWLAALHSPAVCNVSPESFFSTALSCRKWTTEHEAGRAKSDSAHCPLLAKCVQTQTGEACGMQKQSNPTGQSHWLPQGCSKVTLLQLRSESSMSCVFPFNSLHHSCYVGFISVEMFNLLKNIEIICRWRM